MKITDAGLRGAFEQRNEGLREGDAEKTKAAERTITRQTRAAESSRRKEGESWLSLTNWILVAIGVVISAIAFLYGSLWDTDVNDTRRAAGIAVPAAFLVLLFLGLLQRGHGGLLSYVRGKDKRLSTSLTQVGLWTIAVASAFLYFVALDWLSNDAKHALGKTLGTTWTDFPEEYLLLLGGPFAAAVFARLAVGSKVEEGRLQKVEANQTKLRDVVADDDGNGNLVDAQFLVFNLVALTWFTLELISNPTGLPAIPPILVGLTSIAALGYTAAKAAETNQPVVSSVTRYLGTASGIRPGDLVEVQGANFLPPGSASQEHLTRLAVRFRSIDVPPEVEVDSEKRVLSPTNTSIIARAPGTLDVGELPVSVITAAGAESQSHPIRVVADKPMITGLDPPTAAPGQQITLRGHFFRSAAAQESAQAAVVFDEIPVSAAATEDRVSVEVPAGLDGTTVNVSVISAGGVEASEPAKLRLKKPPRVRRRRG